MQGLSASGRLPFEVTSPSGPDDEPSSGNGRCRIGHAVPHPRAGDAPPAGRTAGCTPGSTTGHAKVANEPSSRFVSDLRVPLAAQPGVSLAARATHWASMPLSWPASGSERPRQKPLATTGQRPQRDINVPVGGGWIRMGLPGLVHHRFGPRVGYADPTLDEVSSPTEWSTCVRGASFRPARRPRGR